MLSKIYWHNYHNKNTNCFLFSNSNGNFLRMIPRCYQWKPFIVVLCCTFQKAKQNTIHHFEKSFGLFLQSARISVILIHDFATRAGLAFAKKDVMKIKKNVLNHNFMLFVKNSRRETSWGSNFPCIVKFQVNLRFRLTIVKMKLYLVIIMLHFWQQTLLKFKEENKSCFTYVKYFNLCCDMVNIWMILVSIR